ncbi:MAG: hypothetical protein WBC44_09465 [Planctomycetaceae bacterium]
MADQYLQQLDRITTAAGTELIPISDDPAGDGRLKAITVDDLLATVEIVVDHGELTGLTTGDPHTQYALLAGRAGGQTIVGGTVSGNSLTLKGEAGDAALTVSASGHVCTVRQTASVPGVLVTGPGRTAGTDAAAGISQFLNVNVAGNRQYVIGPSNGWGNASVKFFRLVFASGGAALDAITGTGQRADIMFGTSTTNVTFGADAIGPSTAKTFFGGENAKVCGVFRTGATPTANSLEIQNSSGTRLGGFGKVGELLLPVFTDATRPTAGVAGRVIYNSDDAAAGGINVDDGTQWRLGDGTIT